MLFIYFFPLFFVFFQNGHADEYGTLLIVGKFQHKVNKDSPAKEAILLVGDDAALSPNAKEMDELLDEAAKKLDGLEKLEAIDKKFKEEKDRLTGNEKIDFLIKYAQKKGGGFEKVFSLGGAPSRGLIAVAGDRAIQEKLQNSIRGDLTQKDLGKAKDAREKVDSKLRSAEFTDKKGLVVHCQIDPENSKRRIFLYEITPKKFPRVVSSNVRQTEIKNYAANGLGEGLDIVNKWMENFFGKVGKENSWTTKEVETMLKELSKKIKETKYTNLLGANFIGFILADYEEASGIASATKIGKE